MTVQTRSLGLASRPGTGDTRRVGWRNCARCGIERMTNTKVNPLGEPWTCGDCRLVEGHYRATSSSWTRQDQCQRGHDMTPENVVAHGAAAKRQCLACLRMRRAEYNERRRQWRAERKGTSK